MLYNAATLDNKVIKNVNIYSLKVKDYENRARIQWPGADRGRRRTREKVRCVQLVGC